MFNYFIVLPIYKPQYFFIIINITKYMSITKFAVLLAAVLAIALANISTVYDDPYFVPYRKGLTYQAT